MSTRAWIILFAFLCVLCIAVWIFLPRPEGKETVGIYKDGELLHTIDLSKVEKAYEIILDEAGHNTVLVEPGDISVIEADCHDGTCVKRGKISGGGLPIICLPNRLVIKYTEQAENADVDAVAGVAR